MGIYLKIGGLDLSRFMTAEKYSVDTVPVFDEEGAFVNIRGERIRTRIGRKVTVKAALSDVDDGTAAALAAVMDAESVRAVYSAPDQREGDFTAVGSKLSLDRVVDGNKFWSAELTLEAGLIPEDCL